MCFIIKSYVEKLFLLKNIKINYTLFSLQNYFPIVCKPGNKEILQKRKSNFMP